MPQPLLQAVLSLPPPLPERLAALPQPLREGAQELRLIEGAAPLLRANNRDYPLDGLGIVNRTLLQSCFVALCGHAVHSHQRELAQGYITLEGGHRAGFAATAVYDAAGQTVNLRNITAIVLRVARRYPRAADALLEKAFANGLCGLLIAGPPASGKTTVLRELAVALAEGRVPGCRRVAVVDERGELAGFCPGCCVLQGYQKQEGLLLAVRNLSPQVVLCDELGNEREVQSVLQALNSGVAVITTLHAADRTELYARGAGRLLLQSGAFARVAVLSERPCPTTLKEVFCYENAAAAVGACAGGDRLHDAGHRLCRPFSQAGAGA